MHIPTPSVLVLPFLPLLATAHFQILSPTPRGYDGNKLSTYPCGGQDTVSNNRTSFPLAGGPIQLKMGHDESEVQVNLALGNNAVNGNAFTTTILPIVQEEGPGEFCIGGVTIPSSLKIKDGDNATLQVITNGDPSGGLYNCADITFSTSAKPGSCTNRTGVATKAFEGSNKNANGSDSSTASTTQPSPSSSASSRSTSSPSPTNGAERVLADLGGLGLLVGGVVMGILL